MVEKTGYRNIFLVVYLQFEIKWLGDNGCWITVIDNIRTRQLPWYGHVQWMAVEMLPKQIQDWTPQGRLSGERPRSSWHEEMNKEIEKVSRNIYGKLETNGDRAC